MPLTICLDIYETAGFISVAVDDSPPTMYQVGEKQVKVIADAVNKAIRGLDPVYGSRISLEKSKKRKKNK